MNRPVSIWIAFGLCLALLLAAMGWLSVTALRMDRAQAEMQRRADFEENIRLVLWRMDSLLTPLIVQENARPYFHYAASYSSKAAYHEMFEKPKHGEMLFMSPLLLRPPSNILLHFQSDPNGTLSTPTGFLESLSAPKETSGAVISSAEVAVRMDHLRGALSRDLLARACASVPEKIEHLKSNLIANLSQQRQTAEQQSALNAMEFRARNQTSQQAVELNRPVSSPDGMRDEVIEGIMRPLWLSGDLLLVRQVTVKGQDYFQGCWLDWPGIRKMLLNNIRDLLPGADLQPLRESSANQEERLLATLPVRLLPGKLSLDAPETLSPIRFALVVAWGCGLLAASAVGILLHETVSLSERRAAFVSAVTHELRTPLTTFRMYSEMLAEDMVTDEIKKKEYFRTLSSESNRLSHLVENVLAYARLERGRARRQLETVTVDALVERVKPRLIQHAAQEEMPLHVEVAHPVHGVTVQVDVSVVEQILFNLVDNACKYASAGPDKAIRLEALPDRMDVLLRVRDHGPGIPPEGARRLFRPFSKSATEAAGSAPGVGLGLALCRRLSRSMGGDLAFNPSVTPGACFDLTLLQRF
ncbi:MAG: sensor histidine kinase [Verrucomicrobia bacterium]|nr:sensor histidine kinase [Verrucomicrobiota bacterium]